MVWSKGMMYECYSVQGLLILYEFNVNLEISTFCGCMSLSSVLFYLFEGPNDGY
jgi:hypothetical protein